MTKEKLNTAEVNTEFMQIPSPDPALKRLDKLVGTWELSGRTLDSKEDNISGWTTFEWMPGGFFLKAAGEINYKGFKIQSLEIISYDPAGHTFRSNVYSSISGNVFPYWWDVRGDEVTHWMKTAKYMGTFSMDGKSLTGGWRPVEGSENSENVSYDAVMIRVK